MSCIIFTLRLKEAVSAEEALDICDKIKQIDGVKSVVPDIIKIMEMEGDNG